MEKRWRRRYPVFEEILPDSQEMANKTISSLYFRSDDDPDCHDHPWDFASLILWNGYIEESLPRSSDGLNQPIFKALPHWTHCFAPSFRYMKAEHIHKVHLDKDYPAVTLVFAKRAKRNWGFWTTDKRDGWKKWIDWRTYLHLPNAKDHLEDALD